MYIHERQGWPEFAWNQAALTGPLAEVRNLQHRLMARMEEIGFTPRAESTLPAHARDVIPFDGQEIDAAQVRQDFLWRMETDIGAQCPLDRHAKGVVDVLADAIANHSAPLTETRLFGWHAALFPTGQSGGRSIEAGKWRTAVTGPMLVVYGPPGEETAHYEAPGHERVPEEMTRFLAWFNAPPRVDALIHCGVAHFWLLLIHPFEDGNGRIARAIAEMLLARSEKNARCFYSLSAQIQRDRDTYYDTLEQCQKGTLDITLWLAWFLACLKDAITRSEKMLEEVLWKARFGMTDSSFG